MRDPIGIGLVEQLLIDTMAELGATPDRPHRPCHQLVQALHDRHGVHPAPGYLALTQLAAAWLVPVPLVAGHGNLGSPDYAAADPRYTEARLSPAGALAVSGRPRLPIGLINGDLHVGGSRPGFAPDRVLDAVVLAATTPSATDDDLLACIGAPHAATGALVSGELSELRHGRPARLRYEPRITILGADRLAITDLAPGIGPSELLHQLTQRSSPRRTFEPGPDVLDDDDLHELARLVDLPLLDVNDESSGDESRVVLTLAPGADLEAVRRQVLDVWPVVVEVDAQLSAPLAELVRAEVDPHRAAQLAAIDALRQAIRPKPPAPRKFYRLQPES